jgi:hypothetical protein
MNAENAELQRRILNRIDKLAESVSPRRPYRDEPGIMARRVDPDELPEEEYFEVFSKEQQAKTDTAVREIDKSGRDAALRQKLRRAEAQQVEKAEAEPKKEIEAAAAHTERQPMYALGGDAEEKGLPKILAAMRGNAEEKGLAGELRLLKADIEMMIKREGRRSFWSGVWTNSFFFVIGLAVSAASFSSTQVFALFGLR